MKTETITYLPDPLNDTCTSYEFYLDVKEKMEEDVELFEDVFIIFLTLDFTVEKPKIINIFDIIKVKILKLRHKIKIKKIPP